jgi:TolB-like protein/Flp pilus assembly protein TadD
VLPFENLGDSSEAYFADGVSDEVRAKLTQVGNLEVIARASSNEYKGRSERPQEIAHELGATYLLTGTVRWEKVPGQVARVRVMPELLDVHPGRAPHSQWGQQFDAALTDVFQVQSDIATQVAQALNVALDASEHRALSTHPTQSPSAYDAYLKGEEVSAGLTRIEPLILREAIKDYEAAVTLDSTFVQAWLQLARAHAAMYSRGYDPTPTRVEAARRTAARVAALRPNGWESHRAMAVYYGAVLNDMERGFAEASEALRLAPANADLLRSAAGYESGLGKWESAVGHLDRAMALDPRSVSVAFDLTAILSRLRRYPQARAAADRALALDPRNLGSRIKAVTVRIEQGDLKGARAVVMATPVQVDSVALVIGFASWGLPWVLNEQQQNLVLRQSPAAFDNDTTSWGPAIASIYRLRGDRIRERAYMDSARAPQATLVRNDPENADQRQHLGYVLAVLGRKADAIREGERALAQARKGKDQTFIPYVQEQLARIYVTVGEPEKALDLIEPLLTIPYDFSPGWLKLDPAFSPLRGNPRYERLVNGT